MSSTQIRWLIKFFLIALWTPTIAIAATASSIEQTLSNVSLISWTLIAFLSLASGMTARLLRIDKILKKNPDAIIRFTFTNLFADMSSSLMSGILMFFFCESTNTGGFKELGLIVVAAYGGARFIEYWVNKFEHER